MSAKKTRPRSEKRSKATVPSKVEKTFLGEQVPQAIKQSLYLFHQADKSDFAGILKEVTAQLAGAHGLNELEALEKSIQSLDSPSFHSMYTSTAIILRCGFRERLKAADIETDLKAMNFPANCVKEFLKIFKKYRSTMEKAAEKNTLRYPTLQKMKWRVDVTISTSALSRVLKPSVLVQMTLSDGTIKTFEMQVEQFHRLRYNVAKVLQYMRRIESRAIMSLVADLEVGKLKHT